MVIVYCYINSGHPWTSNIYLTFHWVESAPEPSASRHGKAYRVLMTYRPTTTGSVQVVFLDFLRHSGPCVG